jgi:predicted transcriptional regulator
LFISHCSDDVELAARLVALFRVALNIPSSAIRCSSVDGYRLPGGANTDEQLRAEVHGAEAFVGIVSSASVRSLYVLFELGARWGARRQMIPLLAPGTPTSVLGGPLAGLNALSAGSVPQLHQLLSELAAALSLDLESAAGYHDQLQAVADLTARSVDFHPADTTRVSGGDADLPKEAQVILKALVTSNELTPEDIAGQVRLSAQKVEYFLDLLKEREFADEIMYSGRPSEFAVTSKGRKFLFEHGMLE